VKPQGRDREVGFGACLRRAGKGLAKVRADEQESDMRRDVSRDELARDNKVPYLSRERFVNQALQRRAGSYALKVLKLTTGDLLNVQAGLKEEKSSLTV